MDCCTSCLQRECALHLSMKDKASCVLLHLSFLIFNHIWWCIFIANINEDMKNVLCFIITKQKTFIWHLLCFWECIAWKSLPFHRSKLSLMQRLLPCMKVLENLSTRKSKASLIFHIYSLSLLGPGGTLELSTKWSAHKIWRNLLWLKTSGKIVFCCSLFRPIIFHWFFYNNAHQNYQSKKHKVHQLLLLSSL